MADTSSQRSELLESRTCVFSNAREVNLGGLAKKWAGRELVQSGLRRIKTAIA